jgi:plasmid maintenance system antidote protein VapI
MKKQYAEFLRAAKDDDSYWAEIAISDFTDELLRLMKEKQVSRTTLAERIGSSSAYITKALDGHSNFTLSSMVKLARALDSVVRVHLAPKSATVRWEDRKAAGDTEVTAVFHNRQWQVGSKGLHKFATFEVERPQVGAQIVRVESNHHSGAVSHG